MNCRVFFILLSWAVVARGENINDIFRQKLHAIRTMQASFSQTIYTNGHERSHSSGTMALARPGRFRWQITQPLAQWIIADGQYLWLYDVDLEQVTKKKQTPMMTQSAGLFLNNDDAKLIASFNISRHDVGRRSDFDLYSKSTQSDFKHVIFKFEAHLLQGMEFVDSLGQRTVIQFHHIKTNTALPATLFHFTPPKGVDLIDEEERA
jgi:outer membrane lipoprotein carrier protein